MQQMQTELLDSALAMAGQSLHCHHPVDAFPPNFAMDMLALDRQVAGLRWQQHNPTTVTSHAALDHNNHFSLPAGMFLGTGEPAQESTEVLMRDQQTPITTTTTTTATTTDVDGPRMGCGWHEMTQHQMTSHHVQPTSFPTGPFTTVTESKPFSTLSRTTSCPPAMGSVLSSAARMGLRSCKIPSSPLSGDGSRKRKTVRNEVLAALATPKVEGSKTIKGEILEADELGPDVADKGGESSGYGGKENPKGAAPSIPKPDYIHVRARRGQATDSHSLAERVRREKISERMKLLQDLVPGCNKITGKAGMLDEIINYVQSLQRQVEFLSMKLAAVSPKSEGTGDSYMGKEVFPLCHSNFPGVGISPEVTPSSYAHLNMMQSATGASIQQQQGGCGAGGGRIDVPVNSNPSGMTTLRRTTSAPVAVTDDFIDSCFRDCSLPSNSAWDFDLQGLYTMDLHHQPGQQQQPAFSPQTSFVTGGHSEMHNLKMEMM